MDHENETVLLEEAGIETEEVFDLDALESRLQGELDAQLADLTFLEEEREKIGSPEELSTTVMNVVWQQFLNQIAAVAGADFIEENRGLTLDLRDEAHIQTADNFEKGIIASHNTEIDYQERHDNWMKNFKKDESGQVITRFDKRSGQEKKVLTAGARADYDKGRPKGSGSEAVDHLIPAAEHIRDSELAAYMTHEENVALANSAANLNRMDASANQSKGDSTMTEWLDSERNGQKPAERFPIDEEDLREKDKAARENYDAKKEEAKQRNIEAGKRSQKAEFFRISGKALRAVVMTLLADLVRSIIGKLIAWFRSAQRTVEALITCIKDAVVSFVANLKQHLAHAASALLTTIATSIFGPVVNVIRRVMTLLRQGFRSLKEAIDYLRDPVNRDQPFSIKVMQVGKIVVVGLSAAGALALGQVIETALTPIPVMAVEIPLLGSLSSLLGLFMGGVVSGIIGAIAISLIDKAIEKRQLAENTSRRIEAGNEILSTQGRLLQVSKARLVTSKAASAQAMAARHQAVAERMQAAPARDTESQTDHGADFAHMDDTLDGLLADLE